MTITWPPAALVPLTAPKHVELDIVAFPCAGSSPGQFQEWRTLVPPNWRLTSVCLPGRGHRTIEPFATSLSAAADEIAAALTAQLEPVRPLLLAGHSLGGVIAFETARRLPPSALAVFACPPPQHLYGPDETDFGWEDAITQMVDGQSLPADLAAELIDFYRPVYEADMQMLESYVWDRGRAECDIWAFYSSDDFIPAAPWAEQTTRGTDTVTLPGDHYLARDEPERAVRELVARAEAQSMNRPDATKKRARE